MAPRSRDAETLLKAMNEAVLAMASEPRVEAILQRLVESARDLVRAKYAALGIPDGEGGFTQFITTGMSDALMQAIGPLPRTHGLLGAMLSETAPYRTKDIRKDPRFEWWPAAHPVMTSFLGVPIVSKGTVIAAFYLTCKKDADEFSEDDQAIIAMLAAHAAIAIENARLFERSRELSVVEERNRLARDLHDSVSQALFSISLLADAAAELTERNPKQAKARLEDLREMASAAVEEMRSLIFELRPAELEANGLAPTLCKHVEVLSRVYRTPVEFRENGYRRLPQQVEQEIYRVAQEAVSNALKHARASKIEVDLSLADGMMSLVVTDDGAGFDPEDTRIRATRLGITSMEERAEGIGATLRIESGRRGTRVRLEVPVG